jgi:pimeloyl-ACP methyl ester carboxylesterase
VAVAANVTAINPNARRIQIPLTVSRHSPGGRQLCHKWHLISGALPADIPGMGRSVTHRAIAKHELRSTTVRLADGRRIHCRQSAGEGEPLVLLHGLLDSSEGWIGFAAAQHRPCIAFDLPGFGRSDLPRRPRIGSYVEDVQEALELLGVASPMALIGHSFGGAVAAGLAERMADRVSALLMLAPAGFGRIPLAEMVSLPGARQLTSLWLPLVLEHRLPLSVVYRAAVARGNTGGDEMLDRIVGSDADLVSAAGSATRAIAAAGISKHGFHRRQLRYDGPVTVMWGSRDRIVSPKHSRGVKVAFPQARIVQWPGVGHHPQCERPEELVMLAARVCGPCATGKGPLQTPPTRLRPRQPAVARKCPAGPLAVFGTAAAA